MIVAAMLDQGEQALISPLSLPKVGSRAFPLFTDEFDNAVIAALASVEIEYRGPPPLDREPWAYPVVAGFNLVRHKRSGQIPGGVRRAADVRFSVGGPSVSLWLCRGLKNGDAAFWYRSHFRLSAIGLDHLRDHYECCGFNGLAELIASEVMGALTEKSAPVRVFAQTMVTIKSEPWVGQ
jgi:hypothetical protein